MALQINLIMLPEHLFLYDLLLCAVLSIKRLLFKSVMATLVFAFATELMRMIISVTTVAILADKEVAALLAKSVVIRETFLAAGLTGGTLLFLIGKRFFPNHLGTSIIEFQCFLPVYPFMLLSFDKQRRQLLLQQLVQQIHQWVTLADIGSATTLAAFARVVLNPTSTFLIEAFIAFVSLRVNQQRVTVQAFPVCSLIMGIVGKISADTSFDGFELRNLNLIGRTINTGLGILHTNGLRHFPVKRRPAYILIFQHFIYSNLYQASLLSHIDNPDQLCPIMVLNMLAVLLYNKRYIMQEEEIEEGFIQKLTRPLDDKQQYQSIKESPSHIVLVSQNQDQEGVKTFHYHYAEEPQFQLGAGSYGRIYICFYEEQQKQKVHKLALKIISIPNNINKIRQIQKIIAFTRQQIKSLIKLRQNPNIIKIQDVIGDTTHSRIYLILEYCNDKDLDNYFTKLYFEKKIKKEADVLIYFKQILNAFEDLYKLNIIHRDIKPENILVHNDVIKIADFGLSKQIFEKNEQFYEEHEGTFLTASPQIRFKQKYTNKCDIYSLGITLYWMVYQTFPFRNEQPKEELMKNSLLFGREPPIKVSAELVQLLNHMLAYEEDDRIEWNDLFCHPIFDKINLKPNTPRDIRDTIGRDLKNQYSDSKILDNVIPKQFYMYIMGNNDSLDMNHFASRNFEDDPSLKNFLPIFLEILNLKYRINFLKQLLREVHEFKISQKIKNKIQFTIMKDLIRMGVDKYIIYLHNNIKRELTGATVCKILDPKLVNELNRSNQYDNLLKNFIVEVEQYEKSNKKPKLSEEQRQTLLKRCKQYQIDQTFELILKPKITDENEFLLSIRTCIIQIIYFIKDEVKYHSQKFKNLAGKEEKRYRELILLIHHFQMFILQKSIFPEKYTDKMNYDFQIFNEKEKYQEASVFNHLASNISQIIDRFEN